MRLSAYSHSSGFDAAAVALNNISMSIDTLIAAEAMAELQLAVDRAVKGIRDPEAMRKAILGLNKSREELRARSGTLDVAVELIRESRDE